MKWSKHIQYSQTIDPTKGQDANGTGPILGRPGLGIYVRSPILFMGP